jgi:hypothetical protein
MKAIVDYKATWTKLSKREANRLASELKEVVRAAQRELIRVNVIEGPEREDWKLEDGHVALHRGAFDRLEVERATIVWYAAMAVQAKVAALLAGHVSGVRKHKGLTYTVHRESRYPSYSALGHFCVLLSRDELTHFEIAEVLGELDDVVDRSSDAWSKQRELARRAVQMRIHRFRSGNPEA